MNSLLTELRKIDEEIQANSVIPSVRTSLQNKKVAFLLSCLVPIATGYRGNPCLVLPEELQGKFKTIGYYGKRETLARVFYYFHYSKGDTVEFPMVEGNIYRECGNPICLNPLHLMEGKPADRIKGLKQFTPKARNKKEPSLPALDFTLKISPLLDIERGEEEIERELAEQEAQLIAEYTQQHRRSTDCNDSKDSDRLEE